MDESATILFFLLVLITILAFSCIGLFTVIRWIVRLFTGHPAKPQTFSLSSQPPTQQQCVNCERPMLAGAQFCPLCGAHYLTAQQKESLRDRETTLRELARLHDMGAIDEVNFRILKIKIDNECELIIFPNGRPGKPAQPFLFTPEQYKTAASQVVGREQTARKTETLFPPPLPGPPPFAEPAAAHSPSTEKPASPDIAPTAKRPRKPSAEVLASFMT